MSRSEKFFGTLLSFIAGVFLVSFIFPREIDLEWVFLLPAVFLVFTFVFYENKTVVWGGVLVAIFSGGVFWADRKFEEIRALPETSFFSGRAFVSAYPQKKESGQKIVLRPEGKNFHLLWNADPFSDFRYGEEFLVECQMKLPENFSPDFDYRMYLAKDRIFYVCSRIQAEKTGEIGGNLFYRKLFGLKDEIEEKILASVPFPESGLLIGLLLGGDGKISSGLREDFSKTGMTHIVAVSGYNVAILAEYLMILGIFFGLWRPQAFWLAVLGIIFFILLIGAPPSAVRAGVMGTLLLWAAKNGRLANSRNAIVFSGAVMLFFNPLLLRFDVGFQLSFLATLGIVYLYPVFQNILSRIEKFSPLVATGEILFLTLSAQIFVLPVILSNFGNLSLVSFLANVLVLPVVPLSMLLGFVFLLASFLFQPLAEVFSWLAYLPLKYETAVIRFLADFKYASFEVGLTWMGVLLWYIILGVAVFRFREKSRSLPPSE